MAVYTTLVVVAHNKMIFKNIWFANAKPGTQRSLAASPFSAGLPYLFCARRIPVAVHILLP
ncbi:MAG: hypothetical protein ACYCZT_13905 [Thiobacillus sp.]